MYLLGLAAVIFAVFAGLALLIWAASKHED